MCTINHTQIFHISSCKKGRMPTDRLLALSGYVFGKLELGYFSILGKLSTEFCVTNIQKAAIGN